MLFEKKELMVDILKNIDVVTDLFYQDKEGQGYHELALLLTKLTSFIEFLILEKELMEKTRQEKLLSVMTQAMNAMEEKDIVLLSDILQYELKEQLEDIIKLLK